MGPTDAAWHVLNFFGPAIGLGLIAASLAKLLWWRDLKAVRWTRLFLAVSLACAAVSVAGLVVFGLDGKMATYASMVGACALALWWSGFASKASR